VAKAIECIYRDLVSYSSLRVPLRVLMPSVFQDYARSLIKPRPSEAESALLKSADTETFEPAQGRRSTDDPSDMGSFTGTASQHDSSHNDGHSEDWSVVSDRARSQSRDRAAVDSDSAGVLSGTDGEMESDGERESRVQKRKSRSLLGTLGSILPGKH
jgi:hypothetical protein